MKFKTAEKKLIQIAAHKACSLQYQILHFSKEGGSGAKATCQIYIENVGMYTESSWEEAFEELKKAMRKSTQIKVDENEAPE